MGNGGFNAAPGPNYQQFATDQSSTGAKLLSANRRVLFMQAPTKQLLPGLNLPQVILPWPGDAQDAAGLYWPARRNRRYRFDVTCFLSPDGGQDVLSLEAASLTFQPLNLGGGPVEAGYGKQAILATTTALAANQLIAVEDAELDANDFIAWGQDDNSAVVVGAIARPTVFQLVLNLSINNTGVNRWNLSCRTTWKYEWADYNSYRFTKWE